MKRSIQQLGLQTAAKRRGHSHANVNVCGRALLPGMNRIPAYRAFDRSYSLALNSGELMT